ncbi:hypothetical protein MRX96_024336 [Rhipicephalus microplus]
MTLRHNGTEASVESMFQDNRPLETRLRYRHGLPSILASAASGFWLNNVSFNRTAIRLGPSTIGALKCFSACGTLQILRCQQVAAGVHNGDAAGAMSESLWLVSRIPSPSTFLWCFLWIYSFER